MAFGVLIFGCSIINKEKPPIPTKIIGSSNERVFTGGDIKNGQNFIFLTEARISGPYGDMAPICRLIGQLFCFYIAARHHGLDAENARIFGQKDFDVLDPSEKGWLHAIVTQKIKSNRYGFKTGILSFTQYQTEVYKALTDYYTSLFEQASIHLLGISIKFPYQLKASDSPSKSQITKLDSYCQVMP